MHDCQFLTPDDYPCPEEGTVKVGNKWYCEYHASIIMDDLTMERSGPDAEEDTYKA